MTHEVHVPERDAEGVGYSERPPRETVAQVAAILAGPALFLCAMTAKYAAVHAACRAASTVRLHVFGVLFLVGVALVVFVCHRAWRRSVRETHPDPRVHGAPERRSTAVLLGLLLSLLAALGVVLLWMPVFILDPCRS
jgi:hypothetical protein